MMMTFLKNLSVNLLTVLAAVGLVYACAFASKHWFGNELYGFIALISGVMLLWIIERSYKDAVRKERQMKGIAKAKEKGVYKGRKRSIDVETVNRMRNQGMGATAIARQLGIDRTSVYRVLKDSPDSGIKKGWLE